MDKSENSGIVKRYKVEFTPKKKKGVEYKRKEIPITIGLDEDWANQASANRGKERIPVSESKSVLRCT